MSLWIPARLEAAGIGRDWLEIADMGIARRSWLPFFLLYPLLAIEITIPLIAQPSKYHGAVTEDRGSRRSMLLERWKPSLVLCHRDYPWFNPPPPNTHTHSLIGTTSFGSGISRPLE